MPVASSSRCSSGAMRRIGVRLGGQVPASSSSSRHPKLRALAVHGLVVANARQAVTLQEPAASDRPPSGPANRRPAARRRRRRPATCPARPDDQSALVQVIRRSSAAAGSASHRPTPAAPVVRQPFERHEEALRPRRRWRRRCPRPGADFRRRTPRYRLGRPATPAKLRPCPPRPHRHVPQRRLSASAFRRRPRRLAPRVQASLSSSDLNSSLRNGGRQLPPS